MPKAVVSTATEKFELKTAPPDGYVVLRRMTFGQKKKRQEMAVDQTMKAEKNGRKQSAELTIAMAQRLVANFEFAACIVDHNLTDDKEVKLNFGDPATLDNLDPRIGDEIETLIGDMNNYEEVDQRGNS